MHLCVFSINFRTQAQAWARAWPGTGPGPGLGPDRVRAGTQAWAKLLLKKTRVLFFSNASRCGGVHLITRTRG